MKRVWPALLAAFPIFSLPIFAQSLVDLQTQAKNMNFSGAPFTRPFKTGTSLPPACTVGDMFFKSDAPPGSNLMACTAENTWTLEAGGGGSGTTQMTANAVGATLTMGTDCSVSSPCNLRFTNRVFSITASAVATLGTGTSPSGVYIFLDATSGRLTLANSGTAVINCNANCDVISGSGFRVDSVPLYQWPVALAGTWDAFQTVYDKRSAFSTAPVTAGGNVAVTVVNGKQIVSYDATSGLTPTGPVDATGASTTKPNRTVGSDPSGACPTNSEVVLSTASGNLFSCLSLVWHSAVGVTVSGGAGVNRVAVLDAGGNLDPTQGGSAMTWDGAKLTMPGAADFRFNNNNLGNNCAGALPLSEVTTNVYKITLTGNCTTTSTTAQSGHLLTFLVCQDSTGGRTFAWPATYHGGMTVGSTASKCNTQLFIGNGTDYYAVTPGILNQ